MCERRGTVMLIQRGDPEITGAIVEGMMAGRSVSATETSSVTASPCHLSAGLPAPSRWESVHWTDSQALDAPKGEGMGRPGKVLGTAQREAVEAEIDRQRILEDLVRVASGSRHTPEEYRDKIAAARAGRERCERRPGPARRLGQRIMGLYGLLVLGMAAAYRSQDAVLGGRE